MGKNPNGAGTVYRESGRGWCAEAHVDLPDGRRKRVRGRGPSPADALRDRLRREQILLEANPAPEALTVRQLAERWVGSAHASRWSSETRRSYKVALERHILPELGEGIVARVGPFDIQRVLDRVMRESKGEHVSVANRCRRVMHTLFNTAVTWGLASHNPVAAVKPVRLPHRDAGWWTREQAATFLQAAERSPYHLLFHAAVVTGLRIGELIALQWGHVTPDGVTVRRTFSQSARGRIQEHPKSRHARRVVPIPPELLTALEAGRGAEHELVFASKTGRLLNPSNVRRALRRIAKRAGVPIIRLHDLRRTYASLLAEDGYHPSVIQRLLGHSSPDLALRVYTSVRDSSAAQAVVSLGGNAGGNPTGPNRPSRDKVAPPGGGREGVEH